jgi:hypothetical protein
MTPKEKAKELCKKATKPLGVYSYHIDDDVKDIALICVDEIIYSYPTDPYNTLQPTGIKAIVYWREVKQEIKKL